MLHVPHLDPDGDHSAGGQLLLGRNGPLAVGGFAAMRRHIFLCRHRPQLLHCLPRGPPRVLRRDPRHGHAWHRTVVCQELADHRRHCILPLGPVHGLDCDRQRACGQRHFSPPGSGHDEDVEVREAFSDAQGAPGPEARGPHPDRRGETGGRAEHDCRLPSPEDDGRADGRLAQLLLRVVRRGDLQPGPRRKDVAPRPGVRRGVGGDGLPAVRRGLLLRDHHRHNRRLRRHWARQHD
mmetsp:Transcript_76427/g.200506  ORF Transcript_76427/g.200506 Transcript_76427/m.200506 type:complete len:237 (-) Transcript_76427:647-1357(-)